MKLTGSLVASAYLVAKTSLAQEVNGNPQSCLEAARVDPSWDYFPEKVEPIDSQLWSVSYHKTYKIAKNLEDGTSYLLYQCGTEPPTDVTANLTLSIPLQNGVALSTTAHLPFMELLGLRHEIKAYLGDSQYISSPCMKERLDAGEAINIQYPNDEGAIDRLVEATSPDIVLFHNPGFNADVANRVSVTAWKERDNHGIGEWIKYFSVFFNAEAVANREFQGIYDRYECTKSNANYVLQDKPQKPKVMVADFSTYCGGWSIGACPNFYCDLVHDCSAELLENDNVGTIVNPACGQDRNYKSTAELVEFAKDVDVWIYPSHGAYAWDSAYADFGITLDQIKAVQNKQVYDTVLTALDTWFEHRLVEYDVVLEDMCNIVGAGHPLIPHKRHFLRNVFDEEVGDLGTCPDPDQPFVIRAEPCEELVQLVTDQNSAASGQVSVSGACAFLIFVMAFLV